MKNLLFITSFFLLYNSSVLGQLFTAYKFEDNDIDYSVYLYKNGMYELVINQQESDDMIFSILVSYGKYHLNKSRLEFSDMYNGYTMKFAYAKDYITAIQSYDWLNKKRMVREELVSDNPIYAQFQISPIIQQRAKFKKLNKETLPLECGEYKNGSFSLVLNSDSTYVYSFQKNNLSKGKWKRRGNEISLYDSFLKHLFYVFLDKKGLINTFLPGESGVYILHR